VRPSMQTCPAEDVERITPLTGAEEIEIHCGGGGPKSRVVVISDTHCLHDNIQVPPGDILIHCGDFTNKGTIEEIEAFNEWFGALPHPVKLFCIGNHEVGMFSAWNPELLTSGEFVDNRLVEVNGLRIYGASWHGQMAASKHMPDNVDIFFTHEPPQGICDGSEEDGDDGRGGRGNEHILQICQTKRPRVVLFGHVHYAHGSKVLDGIVYANCANASGRGFRAKEAANPVTWFDIDPA